MLYRNSLLITSSSIILIAMVQKAQAIDWTTETIESSGGVGQYTSLALDKDGWARLSYYDNGDGDNDLKYAYEDSLGWHLTVVDEGAWVGKWTSIAIDSLGYPHISYKDDGNGNLKHAYKDEVAWYIETVDEYGNVGEQSRLALDSDSKPHIVYLGDYDGHKRLKYAKKEESGWNIQEVETDVVWGHSNISMDLDRYDLPHITYYKEGDLWYAYKMGQNWNFEMIEDAANFPGISALALDQSGYAHVVYVTYHDLKYAFKDAQGWHYSTLSTGDVWDGYSYLSIAIDLRGYVHVAFYTYPGHYQSKSEYNLKYAYKDESGWDVQYAHYSYYNVVGQWCSIAVNKVGEPHISYYDGTNGDLRFARPQSYSPEPFTLLSPSNGSWANVEPMFSWEASSYQGEGLSHYELWIDGVWNKNVPKTQPFSKPASSLSSGMPTWNVKAIKADGTSITSNETWSVRIDATSPTGFNLTSPDDRLWTSDRTPTLAWQASSDAESGLKEYKLYIDGSLARAGISSDSISSTPLWDLSSGDHTWDVVSLDNADNTTRSSQTRTIRIDYTGPSAPLLSSPASGIYTADSTVTFAWEPSTDAGVGLSHYQLWVVLSYLTWTYATVKDSLTDTSYTLLPDQSLIDGRAYIWKVHAVDSLGNVSSAYSKSFHVDLKPPLGFSLVSPTDSSVATLPTPTFSWEETSDSDYWFGDYGSGLSHYQLWIDDTLNVDNIPPATTSSAPSSPLTENPHEWFVKAIDNVGNARSSSDTFTVILDWNPPSAFDLASPADGDTILLSSPVLSWHPSSDAGGIEKYQLWINNSLNRDNILNTDTSSTPVSSLDNGLYNWFVKALDYAVNSKSSASTWSFIVDADIIPPVSHITSARFFNCVV
ncbi:MAG: hypothetical protein IIA61_10095 [Candidatus Marinimicrobia bacterium]|nr:hypothetical protein [Candidatus Neomarinimicrobiota bacterium]